MNQNRRRLLAAAGAASLLGASPLLAQSYPSRGVRFIVPYGPGTTTDLVTRMLATRLGEHWKQPTVVENLVGAGGVIGTQALARSAPDGYTLGMIASNYAISAAVYPKLPYDPIHDFLPVVHVTFNHFVFVVNPAFQANTVAELVALAKKQPGKIDFASSGNGGSPHLAVEMFAHMAGIKLSHIPYRSTGQAITDVVSGQVPMMATSISTLLPHIRTGRLRALAVSGDHRSPLLPDVPTMSEAGVEGYVMKNWNGILAPAGVPAPVVDRLRTDIESIVTSVPFEEQLAKQAAEVEILDGATFGRRIDEEIALWRRVVKESGARVE